MLYVNSLLGFNQAWCDISIPVSLQQLQTPGRVSLLLLPV